jgi:hypothetical protein
MTGFEVFLLIVALIEFVIVMYLYAALAKLRESHKVITEMALGDAEAFIASLSRAKDMEDPKETKLVIEEAGRYLTSYKDTLKSHYERYSSEITIKDVLPFLKKKGAVSATTTSAAERQGARFSKPLKKPVASEEKSTEKAESPLPPEKSEAPTERADKLSDKEADDIVKEALKEAGVGGSESKEESPKDEKKIVTKKPQKKIVVSSAQKESKQADKKTDSYKVPEGLGETSAQNSTEEGKSEDDLLPPPE